MAAENYFVCCWMGRGGKAGDDEFNGSVGAMEQRRWRQCRSLLVCIAFAAIFSTTLKRCTFETMDAFDFIALAGKDDVRGHGLYLDPPFPGAGRRYKHNAGQTTPKSDLAHEATGRRGSVQAYQDRSQVLRTRTDPRTIPVCRMGVPPAGRPEAEQRSRGGIAAGAERWRAPSLFD